jgi:hypothetical protein
MPTDFETSANDSLRFARNWRRRIPMALPAPSGLVRTTPSRLSICTIAGAFNPRTLRKKRTRFSSLTSSEEYSRYLLAVRRGRARPRLSQVRITDGDDPTRRATSPIFK